MRLPTVSCTVSSGTARDGGNSMGLIPDARRPFFLGSDAWGSCCSPANFSLGAGAWTLQAAGSHWPDSITWVYMFK